MAPENHIYTETGSGINCSATLGTAIKITMCINWVCINWIKGCQLNFRLRAVRKNTNE